MKDDGRLTQRQPKSSPIPEKPWLPVWKTNSATLNWCCSLERRLGGPTTSRCQSPTNCCLCRGKKSVRLGPTGCARLAPEKDISGSIMFVLPPKTLPFLYRGKVVWAGK